MRILMLSQFFAPVIGGEERMVEAMSVELSAEGTGWRWRRCRPEICQRTSCTRRSGCIESPAPPSGFEACTATTDGRTRRPYRTP